MKSPMKQVHDGQCGLCAHFGEGQQQATSTVSLHFSDCRGPFQPSVA